MLRDAGKESLLGVDRLSVVPLELGVWMMALMREDRHSHGIVHLRIIVIYACILFQICLII